MAAGGRLCRGAGIWDCILQKAVQDKGKRERIQMKLWRDLFYVLQVQQNAEPEHIPVFLRITGTEEAAINP